MLIILFLNNRKSEEDGQNMHEKIKLLKISKGEGENAREYFIFSPVTEKDLEDPEIQKFFVDFYCSDEYLKQVVLGENGMYAGGIKKSEDGTCKIRFKENSVRAAKMAKSIPGTTQLMVEPIDGSGTLKVPGGYEFLGQMLGRFTIQSYRRRKVNYVKSNMEARNFLVSNSSCNGIVWYNGKIKYNNNCMDRYNKYKSCYGIYICKT